MKRIKKVVITTLLMLLAVNFFMVPIILLDCYIESTPIEWDYFLYVNLYAIICCVTFGYMDKPKLENIILIVILILSLLIWLIPNEFSTQSSFIFLGFLAGRKLLVAVDLTLGKFKKKVSN
jgi:hypothetical protein